MTAIGNVPEINAVKDKMNALMHSGLIKQWEIPYEYILTRLSAAIFFLTATDEAATERIWEALKTVKGFKYMKNEKNNISDLEWRIEFSNSIES